MEEVYENIKIVIIDQYNFTNKWIKYSYLEVFRALYSTCHSTQAYIKGQLHQPLNQSVQHGHNPTENNLGSCSRSCFPYFQPKPSLKELTALFNWKSLIAFLGSPLYESSTFPHQSTLLDRARVNVHNNSLSAVKCWLWPLQPATMGSPHCNFTFKETWALLLAPTGSCFPLFHNRMIHLRVCVGVCIITFVCETGTTGMQFKIGHG